MAEITYAQAINDAISEEMRKDPEVFMMGEDIGEYCGAFGVSKGMIQEFGPERIMDTPIAEQGFVGAAIAGEPAQAHGPEQLSGRAATGDRERDPAAVLPPLDASVDPAPRELDGVGRRDLEEVARHAPVARASRDGRRVVTPQLSEHEPVGDERRRGCGHCGGRVPLKSW